MPLHWPVPLQLLQMVLPGAQPRLPQAVTWRVPLLQVSMVPEGGSQVVRLPTAGNRQPSAGLQVSFVQALPSLHVGAWPPTQSLFWQLSTPLQALPSLQGVGGPKKPLTQRRIWPLPTHWVLLPEHSLQRPLVQPNWQGCANQLGPPTPAAGTWATSSQRRGRHGSERSHSPQTTAHAVANPNAIETLTMLRRPDPPACFTADASRRQTLLLDASTANGSARATPAFCRDFHSSVGPCRA